MSDELLKSFEAGLPPAAARRLDRRAAAGQLQATLEHAQQAFGDLGLPATVFARGLGARCVEETDPLRQLASLHTADLYLALACWHGSARAVALLEGRYLLRLPAALARLSLSAALVQDVVQTVREQLLVSNRQTGTSALERYLGRAPFEAWLRAVGLRTAMRLLRATARELPVEDSFLEDQLARDGDVELVLLRETYRPAFREAFKAGMAALTTRQRNLVRQHHLDGITVERLAVMYSVHRVTASRWLGEARRALAAAVEDELARSLGLGRSECASVVRLCLSRPDLTLGAFIRRP